jgi:hypothetical protein
MEERAEERKRRSKGPAGAENLAWAVRRLNAGLAKPGHGKTDLHLVFPEPG